MKTLVVLSIIFFFVGCTVNKNCEPIYVNVPVVEIKEVLVPIPCILPKINCDFTGDGFTPTQKLLECVIEQKRALEICSGSLV